MDFRLVEIILQMRDDIAQIKGDIAATKDQQAKLNLLFDKSQMIEDKARGAVGQAPPTAAK